MLKEYSFICESLVNDYSIVEENVYLEEGFRDFLSKGRDAIVNGSKKIGKNLRSGPKLNPVRQFVPTGVVPNVGLNAALARQAQAGKGFLTPREAGRMLGVLEKDGFISHEQADKVFKEMMAEVKNGKDVFTREELLKGTNKMRQLTRSGRQAKINKRDSDALDAAEKMTASVGSAGERAAKHVNRAAKDELTALEKEFNSGLDNMSSSSKILQGAKTAVEDISKKAEVGSSNIETAAGQYEPMIQRLKGRTKTRVFRGTGSLGQPTMSYGVPGIPGSYGTAMGSKSNALNTVRNTADSLTKDINTKSQNLVNAAELAAMERSARTVAPSNPLFVPPIGVY